MMPHYNSATLPDVSFSDVYGGRKVLIEWQDTYDEMIWTDQGVEVNLACEY